MLTRRTVRAIRPSWLLRGLLRKFFPLLFAVLLPSFFGLIGSSNLATAGQTTVNISIAPPIYVAQGIGEDYNFSVDITNAQNLKAVRFTIIYNSSFLSFSQILQQSFFPPPPKSSFQYQAVGSLGFLKVNVSLASSQAPLSGNGTLVRVSFKVVKASTSCILSTIAFSQVTLLGSSGMSILCDSVGAICFWNSVGPDPGPGLLSLYANKNTFALGDTVILYSRVTFNGDPVPNKLVAFQVVDPLNNTVTLGESSTDQNGIASISFKVPQLNFSLGVWTAYSTVELDQQVYSGVVNFRVGNVIQPVGGYSFVLQTADKPASPFPLYMALLALSALALVARKPRMRTLRRPQ